MSTMTAPLAHFLTRFSVPPPPAIVADAAVPPAAAPPMVSLTQADLDARLEAAAQAARCEAERRHEAEAAARAAAHEAALASALAEARTDWVEAEGNRLAAMIDVQVTELRTLIADRLAKVLGPLVADAARTRATEALIGAVDRLLADPSKPPIRIAGPEDLLAALRAARPGPGIEWVVECRADVIVTAGAAHIETRLESALAGIAAAGD